MTGKNKVGRPKKVTTTKMKTSNSVKIAYSSTAKGITLKISN